ncbi:MAG: thrombospondin type 3 repeat-containing protein, partial [Planctomycetota bacterium]
AGDTFLYNYGPFVAPNGSGGFSNVALGEGGADQGDQQLVTFSDYNNADHGVGNQIISVVFQEQTIAAGDADLWFFEFDAKQGDLAAPSTALAVIRVLDPNNNFALTSEVTFDVTSLDPTWQRYSVGLGVSSDWAGQLLQFGFQTTASNFTPSGVFFDNIRFGTQIVDGDFDGIDDGVDNCLLVANADQRDTDGDGFGNACDADLNNDGVINVIDLGILRTVFFTADPDADFNGDGTVNVVDLGIMRSAFFGAPGPAAG